MTLSEIVRSYAKDNGISLSSVADTLEIERGSLYSLLSRSEGMTLSLHKTIEWLDKMGYQLVVQSVESDEEYILDGEIEGL